jgi:3-methyl-2-oxobutanoate hydroxymethyltransferase
MSKQSQSLRLTAPDIAARKGDVPIVSLTAYHAHTARMIDPHVDAELVELEARGELAAAADVSN